MKKVMTAKQASSLIKNNDTILITGSGGGLMDADFVYHAIEKRFLETCEPNNLTLVHVTGIGNRKEKGISRFAHKGMIKGVVGGHWFWPHK